MSEIPRAKSDIIKAWINTISQVAESFKPDLTLQDVIKRDFIRQHSDIGIWYSGISNWLNETLKEEGVNSSDINIPNGIEWIWSIDDLIVPLIYAMSLQHTFIENDWDINKIDGEMRNVFLNALQSTYELIQDNNPIAAWTKDLWSRIDMALDTDINSLNDRYRKKADKALAIPDLSEQVLYIDDLLDDIDRELGKCNDELEYRKQVDIALANWDTEIKLKGGVIWWGSEWRVFKIHKWMIKDKPDLVHIFPKDKWAVRLWNLRWVDDIKKDVGEYEIAEKYFNKLKHSIKWTMEYDEAVLSKEIPQLQESLNGYKSKIESATQKLAKLARWETSFLTIRPNQWESREDAVKRASDGKFNALLENISHYKEEITSIEEKLKLYNKMTW